jgi:ABC-type transport system substrate-binding protein
MGMVAEAGMRGTVDPVDVNTDWRPKYADAKGQFDGFSARLVSPGTQRNAYFAVFNQKGSQFHGFSKTGSPNADGDPYLDEITTKIRGEFDLDKAQALAHQLQQYEASTQYMPYFPGGATSFGIGWPVIGNLGVYRADPTFRYTWIDDSKPPLKPA